MTLGMGVERPRRCPRVVVLSSGAPMLLVIVGAWSMRSFPPFLLGVFRSVGSGASARLRF